MKVLDAIGIARRRFNRDHWRRDHAGWRKVIRNVKMLCEKHGIPLEDFMKRDTNEKRSEFIDDWNAMVAHVAEFSAKHELPVGELVFPPLVLDNLRDACGERLLDTFIVNGVRTRFGRFVQADVFRQY